MTRVEQLSLSSFVAQGHKVHLHCYDEPHGVPPDVTVTDASSTIPEGEIFYYGGRSSYAGRGSIAGFADWFRYEVLHKHGGIWVDTDMVCLQPFRFDSASVFGWESRLRINIAVLGLPAGDPLARWMADLCISPNRIVPYDTLVRVREKLKRRLLEGNKRANVQWGELGPSGFTQAAEHLGRTREALPEHVFYSIRDVEWRKSYEPLTVEIEKVIHGAYGIHLWNELSRRDAGFNKNGHHPGSLFEDLWDRYCI
nr:glycosyltransferase [Ornithinimicrobium cryptoxanthini]